MSIKKHNPYKGPMPIAPDVYPSSKLSYAIGRTIIYLRSNVSIPQHYKNIESYIDKKDAAEKYREIINQFKNPVLADVKRVSQITAEHVNTYFDILIKKGCKKDAIINHANILKKFFYLLSMVNLLSHIDNNIDGWLNSAGHLSALKESDFTVNVKLSEAE